MPEEAVTFWQGKLQEALKTDAWKEVAAKNQWETTYMDGEELEAYLKKTNGEIATALEETGAIGE
jgi:putative tricarboxylic transport membrane protein